jgi:hypothetical protein
MHGSWLNIAENELSALSKQCHNRRIPDLYTLNSKLFIGNCTVMHWYPKSIGNSPSMMHDPDCFHVSQTPLADAIPEHYTALVQEEVPDTK